MRRAIVSPDDTFITAGGGVAEGILLKAGRQYVLNEVAKFVPVSHGSVVVTSAGKLPVHYILHASAIEVRKDASYSVSIKSVREATTNALQLATALDVRALWLPLMGTGLAGLEPASSLKGILEAVVKWKPLRTTSLLVHIFKHSQLEKNIVERVVRRTLPRSS